MVSALYDQDFGFTWGPLQVRRIAAFKLGKGKAYILGVSTNHHQVEIYVSETGRSVRVFIDGQECKP